ncbi:MULTISPECIES: CDP-alcohol phosphatidyltransferase family protein [Sulfurovum]|uniref:CDP-alcohol phosphatidyltransferase family protein n=1 Tax=Sulfurovum xiamenensis TaxID=3019066 RepID=A0ABT7QQ82_9BACT|nr:MULTISPECIES: CDP-alcohol phosphatidyltransferase family protein [Sulfurovum]EIF51283.1 phosphatidylglycerophosphate synthase [Sulfurovum sp. AR]MDM5263265.1 CDP-alcohol phosphatidyltransferase family protein [Sulfurovum xiamenensis]
MLRNIPNILSLFRIIAAPFLLLAGWLGMVNLFYILFGLMLLSDALDGIIARVLDQTSELGARLDSYGDILTYLSTPLAVWWLWPDLIKKEIYYIIAAIIIYVLPSVFSLIKFGKLASYHTWITKFSAVMMSIGVVILLGFGHNILFHLAVYFLVIEMIENILITMILPKQYTDVHSLWHAWKKRN